MIALVGESGGEEGLRLKKKFGWEMGSEKLRIAGIKFG